MSPKNFVSCVALVTGMLVAVPAVAQDTAERSPEAEDQSGPAPNEIIVTAQKREQSLQKVPVSIEVVTGDTLAERNIASAAQLSTVVPSFEFVRAPNQIPGLTYRGIGPQSGNIAFDSSIGMFADGVFLGNVRLYNQTLFDVQRAELIKGGQGALLGKNTTIGALSIVNARPTKDTEGRVEIGGEVQNGGYFGDAAVNLPVSEAISLRFSGRYDHAKGWLKNVTTGLDGPVSTNWGVRGQALVDPGNGFELLLSYQHTDNKVIGSSSQIFDLGLAEVFQGAGNDIGGVTWGTNRRASFSSDPRLKDGDDVAFTRADIATATASYDFGAATVTSITSGIWSKSYNALDFDFDNKDATIAARDEDYRQFTQELRIASNDGNAPFQYLAGLFYFNSKFNLIADYDYGIPDFPPPFLGLPLPPGSLFNGAFDVTLDQKTEAIAAFGQITVKPTDKLTINLSARYSREEKHAAMSSSTRPGPITLWNTIINAPFPYQTLTPTVDNLISGGVSVQYQFSSDIMGYANYSRGGKAGGYGDLNTFSFDGATFYNGVPGGNPQRDAFVGKERSDSYEVGLKTRLFDRMVTANVAGFWMDLYGLQQLVFTPAGAFVSSNDRVRSRGVEGSVEVQPDSHLSLGFAATYADVLILDTRQRIAQSPRFSGTAHIDWGADVSDGLRLSFGAAVRHRSSKYNQLGETEYDGPFTTLGLRARLESDDGWFVNANAENVTNSRGADFGYPGPDPFVGSFKSLAPLRTIWISAGFKF